MAVDTEQGFLGSPPTEASPISVQTDFGLGEQSAFLTEADVDPSQPYQVTTFQETIAASPAISVGGGYDPYANDLTNIISPFTDPEQIRERREKEKKQREQVRVFGGADPLFQYEPNLNITSPDVPQFAANVPDPFLEFSPTPRTDLTRKGQAYGLETEVDEDYYSAKYDPRRPGIDGPTRAEVAGNILQEYGMEKVEKAGSELAGDMITDAYKSYFPTRYPSSAFGGGMPTSWSGTGYGGSTSSAVATGGAQALQTSGAGVNVLGQPMYGSTAPAGASMGAKALGYAGAAYGLYNAAEAWGNKDYAGAVTNTAWAVASVNPAALPYAIGLEAISQIGRAFGWWGKKPKPGFGGAEIRLNKENNNLEFETTYGYNGFDPSQAKQHANQAVQFLNGWSKKFGMKLNYEKANQAIVEAKIRGGNYLRRIDVSPWKDGSGSSSEMIERWINSGAYEGNPTYFNTDLGQRVGFSSQEQYEKEVNKYAKSIFG
jgi:hypothetical protein